MVSTSLPAVVVSRRGRTCRQIGSTSFGGVPRRGPCHRPYRSVAAPLGYLGRRPAYDRLRAVHTRALMNSPPCTTNTYGCAQRLDSFAHAAQRAHPAIASDVD